MILRSFGIARYLAVTVFLFSVLGACTPSVDSGKDAPLPVKSREEAEGWARGMAEHLTQMVGISIDSDSHGASFNSCTGRKGEKAPDDRYGLTYSTWSSVPPERQVEVVRKMRDKLKSEGLDIRSYREEVDGKPEVLVNARHPESKYYIELNTTADPGRMVLSIGTPCLMPPSGP